MAPVMFDSIWYLPNDFNGIDSTGILRYVYRFLLPSGLRVNCVNQWFSIGDILAPKRHSEMSKNNFYFHNCVSGGGQEVGMLLTSDGLSPGKLLKYPTI